MNGLYGKIITLDEIRRLSIDVMVFLNIETGQPKVQSWSYFYKFAHGESANRIKLIDDVNQIIADRDKVSNSFDLVDENLDIILDYLVKMDGQLI